MDRELEIAGAASAGGWLSWRKHHTLPVGAPCPNCATPLAGPYCHECGQLGEQFHRSLTHLVWEAFENFFHVDGRLFHTLPRLIRRPAQLTRDYIEGRRAAQIPPLRLFLVVMLIFFFAGGLQSGHTNIRVGTPADLQSDPTIAPEVKAKFPQFKPSGREKVVMGWLQPRMSYAASHPREFTMVFESWTHRIAVAMLPVAAAILSLLFVFQRRFFVFDHLIFSMHSLSFMGLLATLVSLIGLIPVVGMFASLIYLVAPVHLFVHMRGVYGIGVLSTLWRMLVLFIASCVAFAAMMMVVALIGLTEMEAPSATTPARTAQSAAATPAHAAANSPS